MPEPELPSEPPKEDRVDKLVAALEKLAEPRPVAAAPPPPSPEPPADDTAEEFERLVNEGKAGEALKLVQGRAFNPQSAQLAALQISLAEKNLADMRSRFGKKFTSREGLFREWQKRYNLPEVALSNSATVEQLWNVVLANDPTYVQEEVASRLAVAEAERQAQIAKQPAPSLAPTINMPPVPEPLKALADAELGSGNEERGYKLRQLDTYGVSLEAMARQAAKADRLDETEGVGVGAMRKVTWTVIGGSSRPAMKEKR